MIFDKTINDIIDYTGLKYEYIIKCTKEMDTVLKPHIQRGDKNSLIFDSSALKIFDRIKQLKDGKQSITSIKVQLESELDKTSKDTQNTTSNLINDTQNMQESELTKLLINKLEEANKKTFESLEKVLESKDQVIEVQRRENIELKNQILLITAGKTPEELRAEQQIKEQEIFRLKQKAEEAQKEVEGIKIKEQEKEKELLQLKQQAEQVQKESQEVKVKVSEQTEKLELVKIKEEKRQEIIKELKSLEGKWFTSKQRQNLITQLQELG